MLPCFSLCPHLPTEHLTGDMTFRSLFWAPRALCSLGAQQPEADLGPVPSAWQSQVVASTQRQSWSLISDSWLREVVWVSTGPWYSWIRARRVGKTLESQARGILGKGQGLVHWVVRQRWLKSWVMTDGSATVDVSPRSWSFLAIFRSTRLMIFPERVLGKPGAFWM